MPSIFLCHSSRDKVFVRQLAKALTDSGVKVWLDEAEIRIGESLTEKIGRAIDEMDHFGAVLSSTSINSEWVHRELQIATQRELAQRQVVVLPLLLEPVEMPQFLRDKLYADFTKPEKYLETFHKLLAALGISEPTPIRLPIPPGHPTIDQLWGGEMSREDVIEFQDTVKTEGRNALQRLRPPSGTGPSQEQEAT